METNIRAWLYDMLESIHEVESYFADIPMEFDIYKNDLKTKRAVERNVGIIGEAMNRILQADTPDSTFKFT